MPDPTLNLIITAKRPLNILLKEGYKTYNDVKNLTLNDLLAMDGMGDVSAHTAWEQLNEYKNSLYGAIAEKAIETAKRVGIEKTLKTLEELE